VSRDRIRLFTPALQGCSTIEEVYLTEKRGLAQEEAARLSGFDYKYFQRIENGEKQLT
jgi:hypothetical protein